LKLHRKKFVKEARTTEEGDTHAGRKRRSGIERWLNAKEQTVGGG